MPLIKRDFEIIPTEAKVSQAYNFDAGQQWRSLIEVYSGAGAASAHSNWFLYEPQAYYVYFHAMFAGDPVTFPAGAPSAKVRLASYTNPGGGPPVWDRTWPEVPAMSGFLANTGVDITAKWNSVMLPNSPAYDQVNFIVEVFGKGSLYMAKVCVHQLP